MKTMLLMLALTLSAASQTLGILAQVRVGQAIFLEDSETRIYGIPADLARHLSQRGPGSRWEYHPEGSLLRAAIDRGNDANVHAAMQTLSQFVQGVNQQNWPAAAACMPPHSSAAPQTAFARHTLSPHMADWALVSANPDQVVLKIHSTQGGVFEDSFQTSTDPTSFSNEFTLTRQGYRWLVESFR